MIPLVDKFVIKKYIESYLEEDIGWSDITTDLLIDYEVKSTSYIKAKEEWNGRLILKNCYEYDAMRLFCLDTQLISFNDIELMESEINSSF